MSQDGFSLIILYKKDAPAKYLHLSASQLVVVSSLIVSGLLLVAWALTHVFQFTTAQLETNRLKEENQKLRKEFLAIETKVQTLEEYLSRARTFVTKLKTMTDMNSLDTLGLQPELQFNLHSNASTFDSLELQRKDAEELAPLQMRSQAYLAEISVRVDKALEQTKLQEQSITELWQLLADRQSLLASMPSIKPTRGWLSSTFGYRPHPITGRTTFHNGIDLAGNLGTPVIAPAQGVVSFVGYDDSYGKVIEIDHGYQISTRYAHLSQTFVKVGQRVQRLDVIGAIGNTGRSTGTHLHYEIRVGGLPRNPLAFLLDADEE
jgi:murein DD-endopeptidase MepM/ murein hydrolase activator NlpD